MKKRYFFENLKKKFQMSRAVPIIVMIVVLGLSIGYSAFSSTLNITGFVSTVRIKKDIRITGVNVVSEGENIVNNGGFASNTEYNVKSIYSTINLPNDNSSITFNVEITNIEAQEMGILDITGLPDNLDYELIDYKLKDKICDETGKCNLGIKKYIQFQIKYKENGYNSDNTSYNISPVFNFQPVYKVTYTDIINNNYPTEVLGRDTLEIDLGNNAPRYVKVLVNNKEIIESDDIPFSTDISLIPASYTYSNGLLTIYNINGNVEIKDAIKTVSSDNGAIVLNDVKETTISALSLSGNSIQNGTPSPTNPVEIESVGDYDSTTGKYVIPITVSGKNLINPNKVSNENVYIVSSLGTTLTPSATGGTWRASDYIKIEGGKTYHLNAINNNANAAGMAWYDIDKKYISGLNTTTVNNNNGNMVAPDNAYYIRVSWRIDNEYNPNWSETLQLEKGTEETSYEPYVESNTYNIYLDEPLRKIDKYEDYIDFNTNKVIRNIKNTKITTTTWKKYSTYNTYYILDFVDAKYDKEVYCLSNLYKGGVSGSGTTYSNGYIWFQNTITYPRLYISDDNYADVNSFGSYMSNLVTSGTPIDFYYVLNEPNINSIDLHVIKLSKGYNIITIDTEISPSNIEIKYY